MPPANLVVAAGHTLDFEAIGTHWQIETDAPLDPATREAVAERIEFFDRSYSRFRPDSLVSRLAREGGPVAFPADAAPLFALYDRLSALTDGAVDPLVGRELERLGYDAEYSLAPQPDRTAETRRWSDIARSGPGATVVESAAPLLIDVGAAGKGYLVDLLSGLLAERGHAVSIVDGSGDLRHRSGAGAAGAGVPLGGGGRPHRVALEHPLDSSKAIGVANLQDRALCASAGNRRTWGDGLHHILDARTGSPARRVIATWVVSRTALEADGLATALFFARAHTLAEGFHFSYVRMFADGRAEISRDFDGELFT